MKRFINDIKKYLKYITYSTKAEIKTEVINSYLGWFWLILEPLCFMLIYAFIAGVVFKSKGQYFPVFVFIGLTVWNLFSKTLSASVKMVVSNKEIVTKVYVPKFVLLLIKMGVNIFKMGIQFLMVFAFIIIYRIPITWNILWAIPIIIVAIVLTFGICSIAMHFGVFAEDLANIVNIVTRLLFYMTGIFYDIPAKISNPLYKTILLDCNPFANLIYNLRQVLIYSSSLSEGIFILIWFVIGIFLCVIGVKAIYKYENTYVKVMKG